MSERFVRVCPTHLLELSEVPRRNSMRCPRGHPVYSWTVADTRVRRVGAGELRIELPQRLDRGRASA